ncbi:DUF5677 domain-containing protein [Paenibacillus sp. sgz500958]|uniref:DUF5677 domain-containing protein n=1 Tax=Paenibacillus sp. sgz500958 TaxID=3242475 RepID=UPI0036D2F555
MYDLEIAAEMNYCHRKALELYEDWARRMDQYLMEEQPHNLLSHVTVYLITKFHKSMLALRLILVSGFVDEAYVILRMMEEYSVTLQWIRKDPEERAARFAEDPLLLHNHDGQPIDITCEANITDWFHPHLRMEAGELILPAGPAPFNANDMLSKACQLAALMLKERFIC